MIGENFIRIISRVDKFIDKIKKGISSIGTQCTFINHNKLNSSCEFVQICLCCKVQNIQDGIRPVPILNNCGYSSIIVANRQKIGSKYHENDTKNKWNFFKTRQKRRIRDT